MCILEYKVAENGLLDQALYKCSIIITYSIGNKDGESAQCEGSIQTGVMWTVVELCDWFDVQQGAVQWTVMATQNLTVGSLSSDLAEQYIAQWTVTQLQSTTLLIPPLVCVIQVLWLVVGVLPSGNLQGHISTWFHFFIYLVKAPFIILY